MNTDKVSVIIPSYNRFDYLLNAIEHIKKQTYQNIEIIVINDCSTQEQYYTHNWENIKIIHLSKNGKEILGHISSGYVRDYGIKIATGKYIAFCDDDDIWFSNKLELQIDAMKKTGCKMSSTDGLIGIGIYNPKKIYKMYNSEHYFETIKQIYKNAGSTMMNDGYPNIWTLNFLKIHNCMIASSVIVEKEILEKINYMGNLPGGQDDYDCWIRCLNHTNSVYVKDKCFYYDAAHNYGIILHDSEY